MKTIWQDKGFTRNRSLTVTNPKRMLATNRVSCVIHIYQQLLDLEFQHYTTQQIIDAYKSMNFKPPHESPLFVAPAHIKWSILRDLPREPVLTTSNQ